MILPATTGSFRIPGLEVRVPSQATSFKRKSPVVPTARHSSLRYQRYYAYPSALSKESPETLYEFDKFGLKRYHFGFDEYDTDDEVARQAQQPIKSSQTKKVSPLQAIATPEHQDCIFTKAGPAGGTVTFPQPYPMDRLLHIPVGSQLEQLNFDSNTENQFGSPDAIDWDAEETPELEYDLTRPPLPGLVHGTEDELVSAREYPVHGSERKPDFEFCTDSELALADHPDALVCSYPAGIEVSQEATTTTKACYRRAARSEPGCSRNRCRRNAKAKAQCLRDRSFRSASMPIGAPTALRADSFSFLFEELKPKRKHCAFVQEQELKCLFEDRVGTPHLSELEPGDAVNAQLNVDEHSVGGEFAALSIGDGATQGLSTFVITDIPSKEPSPS
jgi:hypothetical protein